jgi:hypothetical protein
MSPTTIQTKTQDTRAMLHGGLEWTSERAQLPLEAKKSRMYDSSSRR